MRQMKMISPFKHLIFLIVLASIVLAPVAYTPAGVPAHTGNAYVEPGLLAADSAGEVSIILTSNSAQMAAQAVRQVGGRVSSELWLIDAVAAVVPAQALTRLVSLANVQSVVANKAIEAAVKPGPTPTPTPAPSLITSVESVSTIEATLDTDDDWVTTHRFPVPWDGSPDVSYDLTAQSFKIAYPVAVDIGADQIKSLTGSGVTVAVVDSGIYFDPMVSDWLSLAIREQYLGQADFIAPVCQIIDTTTLGTQYLDHCFRSSNYSLDPYGHGSHVAGIIWDNLEDLNTGLKLGVAPEASVISVRVLDRNGSGSYETVIQGIQYVLANQAKYNIRVLNLSLSATQTTPYFMDPLNRAVEKAWQAGIVVVAAAGNAGPGAETISVPGNDPYVITVGAVDGRRTAGYWKDDLIPTWSSSGPTLDGFLKPDIVAPGAQIISFMHNALLPDRRAYLVSVHPDYALTSSLFRMNGTSMATAVVSGVVALMLEANPGLNPDQVKYRLMATARQMTAADAAPMVSPLQQGAGRVWAPDAVNATLADGVANAGMDLAADLAAGWGSLDENAQPVLDFAQLSQHYLGAVRKSISDDGRYALYYAVNLEGQTIILGVADALSSNWLLQSQVDPNATWTAGKLVWSGGADLHWTSNGMTWFSGELFDGAGKLVWSGGVLVWSGSALYDAAGKLVWSGGDLLDAAGKLVWSGGKLVWSGSELVWGEDQWSWMTGELFDVAGMLVWSGGKLIWSGSVLFDAAGKLVWSGGDLFDAAGKLVWSGAKLVWSGGKMVWSGGKLVWSGSLLLSDSGAGYDPVVYDTSITSENYTWSSGNLVWSGGKLIWSGANLVWSGDAPVWESGKMVWSGGKLVWSGATDWTAPYATSIASLSATNWVDWR